MTIRFEDSPREDLYGYCNTDSGSPWHDYRYCANAIYSTREQNFKSRRHDHINHAGDKVKPEAGRYRRAEVHCRDISEPQSRSSRDKIQTEGITYCSSVIEEKGGDTTGGSNQGGLWWRSIRNHVHSRCISRQEPIVAVTIHKVSPTKGWGAILSLSNDRPGQTGSYDVSGYWPREIRDRYHVKLEELASVRHDLDSFADVLK